MSRGFNRRRRAMTRLLRASMIALSPPTSAATAYAECAWVV